MPKPVEYEVHYVPHAHTGQPVAVRVPKLRPGYTYMPHAHTGQPVAVKVKP
jgi:hypothetical protein